jgi:hypothetical protein
MSRMEKHHYQKLGQISFKLRFLLTDRLLV